MAHVHAAKAVAETGAKMMGMAMDKMGEAITQPMVTGAVAGAVATARTSTVKKILTHPLALLGLGFALGYVAYKYRHQLIETDESEH